MAVSSSLPASITRLEMLEPWRTHTWVRNKWCCSGDKQALLATSPGICSAIFACDFNCG